MINRLRGILVKDPPYGWVILLSGTDDVIHKVPAEKIFNEVLQPMYDMCLHYANGKAKLVILTVHELWFNKPGTDNDKDRQVLNTMIRDYVVRTSQQNRICLVDLDRSILYHSMINIKERKAIWDQGIHFTPAGYDRVAKLIFDVIRTKL